MRLRMVMLGGFCLLGCGSSGDRFTMSVVVMHDGRFAEPMVTYEFRRDSVGIVENGDVPLVFSGGSIPASQRWEVVTALPAVDDYEVVLNASPPGVFGCTGTADFSVPPRELGVFLDCRADPNGPPAGVELSTALLYVVGNIEVE